MSESHVYYYHRKVGPCLSRPAYRDGKQKKAVKVFTIATESSYLLICGVPSIKLEQALKDKCKQYGRVETIRQLSDYPRKEEFTDVFLVKMDSVQSARRAKRSLDDSSFYGGSLHVCYAPEYESVAECRLKLHQCRRDNARISRKAEYEYAKRLSEPVQLRSVQIPSSSTCTPESNIKQIENTNAVFHQENIVQIALDTERIETHSYSGDALDDARQYWRNKGADFASTYSTPGNSCAESVLPDKVTTELRTKLPASRPMPLPVMQALSWKPYKEHTTCSSTLDPEPASSTVQSTSTKSSITLKSSSFVPRCLQTKPVPVGMQHACESACNYPLIQPVHPPTTHAINVGELKRLALTLGPEQGPQGFPTRKDQVVGKRKSIVFHRPLSKRQKLDSLAHVTLGDSQQSTLLSVEESVEFGDRGSSK